ncbi:MAG TPA: DUF1778 domain-containing protein [Acidimicrobiales bacterium]|nr:DUF1778 domain-containing protein [Acidimicrobiales bacterium]
MSVKDRRREFRLTSSDDDVLAEAAGLTGMTVSEFVLGRAVADAEAIVDAHRTIALAPPALADFIAALDAPARPPAALVAQAKKARRLKRVD